MSAIVKTVVATGVSSGLVSAPFRYHKDGMLTLVITFSGFRSHKAVSRAKSAVEGGIGSQRYGQDAESV